ncbi:thioredoxin fold domain-containing protein [Aestuariibaculum sp. M13]|uniref:thioredoxin family protein n=1 Tax=Aestuariibaculum sp. M13 TaxID=2967132 RepID=UPI002159DB1F|nr:thioredoxin fold domain-containing protein [Aestuariibaculum sp. M13]MCR8666549.1 thioredoxin fold domain-containing protein [Aestuariibaculum sp. M13]
MITKKSILYTLLLLPVLAIAQGIHFEKGSFQQAFDKAKKENKVLFVDGYADWCAPCKKMAKTVFMEEEVGAYFNEHFVSYKLNIEKGNGPKLKEKYGIQGLPSYVFIDANDEVVYRSSSAMPAEEFLSEAKAAMASANNPNSIARLSELYNKNKEDEALLAKYLDKLLEVKTDKNYTDILEQYLKVQTSIADSSQAMVNLLANHNKQLVFGGEADRIINENLKTKAWKKYVRKDIREIYQGLPKKMITATTEYAIVKRDTTYLELTFQRAGEAGFTANDAQRKRMYTYYYLNSGQGEKYKALVHDDIVKYVAAIDKEGSRAFYLDWLQKRAEGDQEALRMVRPNAVKYSEDLYRMLKDYVGFVNTQEEKKEVLSWMEVAYYIRPNSAENTSNYANILYVAGDKNKAIEVKEEAFKLGQEENLKRLSAIKGELDLMKAGEDILL